MKNEDQDLRVSARTARLTAGIDDENGPPYRFGGIAVAAGDILHLDDGTRVLMTSEELQKAAETQAGQPLTKDHPEDEHGRPKYPPDVDETFGKVPKAGWVESQEGVGYEATTHDEAVAKGVQGGSYDVSVHPFFEMEPYDGAEADVVATGIQFGDLSVVAHGDSPSATAEWGPNQALASWTESADIGAELTAAADGDGGDDRQGLIASTVRGTLQALGFDGEDLDEVTAGDEPGGNPGSDNGNGSDTMENRNQTIDLLADDYDFDEEWLEDQDDDVLEQLSESVVESGDDNGSSTDPSGDGTGADTDTDDPAVTFETEEEFNEAVEDVLEERSDEIVAEAQARSEKREKAEEIVARSDDYDEDDVEDLVASADSLVDREHKRVRGEGAAGLPGNASGLSEATASRSGDGPDPDEYGTGVSGDSTED